jgi:hypothetical protein
MAQGAKLTKAAEWMEKALKMEAEQKPSMMLKALDMAVKLEKEGIAEGESWDK